MLKNPGRKNSEYAYDDESTMKVKKRSYSVSNALSELQGEVGVLTAVAHELFGRLAPVLHPASLDKEKVEGAVIRGGETCLLADAIYEQVLKVVQLACLLNSVLCRLEIEEGK